MGDATARELVFTEDDLDDSGGSGGAYTAIDVPGDYELELLNVDNYDKRKENKSYGWVFTYGCDGGGGVAEFKLWLSFGTSAQWKMSEVLAAHGIILEPGVKVNMDPNSLVGDVVGGHIDFPRHKVTNEPTSTYREIRQVFALVDAPLSVDPDELEATGTEAPTL